MLDNRNVRRWFPLAPGIVMALSLSLAGCGGGGDSAVRPSNPSPPPSSGFNNNGSGNGTDLGDDSGNDSGDDSHHEPFPAMDAHLTEIRAKQAHQAGFTGNNVVIGIVDTGVNRHHPALQGRVIKSIVYLDPSQNDLSKDDVIGHGTMVAEIAAGKPFRDWPGGVAPNAILVSARIIQDTEPKDDGSGRGNKVEASSAVFFADYLIPDLIDAGVQVMNNSWGGLYFDPDHPAKVAAAFADAYRPFVIDHDGLVVFAAGNSSFDNPSDVASLPYWAPGLERGWLVAVALDTQNPTQLAWYSNQCGRSKNYCLTAPGNVAVPGAHEDDDGWYIYSLEGTSLAAPEVSGAAALVWQAFPYFNNDMVRQTLLSTATDLGKPGVDNVFGWGLLNVGKAVNGPAKFAWGDVSVSFDIGTSIWSNDISGSGGLIKGGNGTLILTGDNTYTGGTTVHGGTLEIKSGGTLGKGSIRVDGIYINNYSYPTLRVEGNVSLSNLIVLNNGAILDNEGTLANTTNNPGVESDVESVTIRNHDGGSITGSIVGIKLSDGGAIDNAAESTITGGNRAILVLGDNMVTVDNNGSSTITSSGEALDLTGTYVYVHNNNNSIIGGKSGGMEITATANVGITNRGGSIIRSSAGTAVAVASHGLYTFVANSGGSTITGYLRGIYLEDGGSVTNSRGSTIKATGSTSGDCWKGGTCSIFVPTDSDKAGLGGNSSLVNAGKIIGNVQMDPTAVNHVELTAGGSIEGDLSMGTSTASDLVLDGDNAQPQLYSDAVTGTTTFAGTLEKKGSGTWVIDSGDLSTASATQIDQGVLRAQMTVPGDDIVIYNGTLDGVPGVAGDLANYYGTVAVHGGDTKVAGDYSHWLRATLAVSLGSKLDVSGTATLIGGTLEVTGKDNGYVANAHTVVLTADGGVSGTFDKLVKDQGVVFISNKIQYGPNEVWLDATGLNITTAAAGHGVHYTPTSMGSARRVQGAFEKLNTKIADGSASDVSDDFMNSAGSFQQSPNLHAAQASLESLSGQLYAATTAITLRTIGITGRALSRRMESRLARAGTSHLTTWTRSLQSGGGMARGGYANVDYQVNGALVGTGMRLGSHSFAGFAYSRGQGVGQLAGRFDRNHSRHTSGMIYGGWRRDRWYAHGRVGVGRYSQRVDRMLLLGRRYRSVWTKYDGHYGVAYSESGRHFMLGSMQLTPFADLEYDLVGRDRFAEHGAGGFGLKANDHTLRRWRAGLGLKLSRQWHFANGGSLELDARAQWRGNLSSSGAAFQASFVGLDEWQPLTGVGLSRHLAIYDLGLNAQLTDSTRVEFGYEHMDGDRGSAGSASFTFSVAF